MRAFIALELPQEVQRYLGSLQKRLRESGCGISWVRPHQIHMTLKFLGDISEDQSLFLQQKLEEIAAATPPYGLSLGTLGAFPGMEKPKVIWTGIGQGAEETIKLAGMVEAASLQEGIKKEERPFAPHLTLGRVRTPENTSQLAQLLKVLKEEPQQQGLAWPVGALTLFKSTLTPQGPVYTPLKVVMITTA